jgi:predicted ATP-grasp superfamily ATP-dependent carboligase
MTDTDDFDTNKQTEPSSNFVWPEPGEDWWNAKGAMFRLDDETIRFSACLHALGGSRARKNSQAAKNAGLDWSRVDAFRVARSAGVARLLDEADKIKRKQLPPLTEEQIDAEVDDLIRAKDPLTKSRGIEIREKRLARKAEYEREQHRNPVNPIERLKELAKTNPELALQIAQKHSVMDSIPEFKNLVVSTCPTCGTKLATKLEIKTHESGNGHVVA